MQSNKKSYLEKLISICANRSNRCILSAASLALLIAVCAFVINFLFYNYPGNNYFPPGSLAVGISLLLIASGFRLLFNTQYVGYLITRELLFFFLVMATIAFMTNGIQYTPFPIIDPLLIALEKNLGIDMPSIVSWTNSYPLFKQLLTIIYASIDYQMAFIPVFFILLMRIQALREYYFLLLFSAFIGFSFYYFFPTVAPASMSQSKVFLAAQYATGIKFQQIHSYIQPTTLEGGMIAMPSFHALWAWFCLYLCRSIPFLFFLLLPINVLLVLSCVLLGWHYPIDILGSVILGLITHGAYYFCAVKRRSGASPDVIDHYLL